jgi:quercetin dioxygenase-like cupin family protein
MKKSYYRDVRPDQAGEDGASGLTVRWVISEKDGAPNFSMRVMEIEPGGHSPFHSHPWEHEVFVLKGEGVLMQGETAVSIAEGDVIFIAPGERHQLTNPCEGNLEFICLIPNPD